MDSLSSWGFNGGKWIESELDWIESFSSEFLVCFDLFIYLLRWRIIIYMNILFQVTGLKSNLISKSSNESNEKPDHSSSVSVNGFEGKGSSTFIIIPFI